MNRRALILAPLMALALALPLSARTLSLAQISGYLNSLTTAKGPFKQINPDGTISTGTLYIKRPGRMRFDYNPPNAALVMAGGGAVAIFDRKSNEPPQQFPLDRTPLSVILARNVDLSRSNMVISRKRKGAFTTITVQDPQNPKLGHIALVFSANPIRLRRWIITDEGGSKTTIILGKMVFGLKLNAVLFSIPIQLQKMHESR